MGTGHLTSIMGQRKRTNNRYLKVTVWLPLNLLWVKMMVRCGLVPIKIQLATEL